MELSLERKELFKDRTIGGLYINGTFSYYTLEDTDRKLESGSVKIPKLTAIPRGRYKLIIDFSNRYQRKMPHILNVPQFEGIRIHTGNYPGDTEGCILIGMEYDARNHTILKSKIAFDAFFPQLEEWLSKEDVWLEIT